eukprot:gene10332-8268_t
MIKSTVLQVLAIALLALASSAYGQEWKALLRKKNEPEPAASDKSVKSIGNVVLKLEGDHYIGTWEIKKIVGHIKSHIHEGPESGSGPMVWQPIGLNVPALSGTFSFEIGPLMLNTSVISMEKLNAEGYYVNIHTNKYPDGELRGQFKPVKGK